MLKLTTERITWALGAFLAGMALGGSGLRATPANRKAALQPAPVQLAPFFAFDLEEVEHKRGFDREGQPRLVVAPVRSGKQGLLVRVEVWNPTGQAMLVHPIYPSVYQLAFRDSSGMPVEVYTLTPGYGIRLDQSDLARVDSGNCLSTNYALPSFYKRIRKRNLECRVRASTSYSVNPKGDLAPFELASDWVKVPAP